MITNVVIPSRSIPGEAERYLLNRGISLPIGDIEEALRQIVRSDFEEALRRNRELFDSDAFGNEVRIEMRDDLGDPEPDELARFDAFRTERHGVPCFVISAHLAFNALLRRHGVSSERFRRTCATVWEHELIHLCDQDTLGEFARQWELAMRSGSESGLMPVEQAPHREWEFLGVIARLRAEGLAMLYEWMSGSDEPRLEPASAKRRFRHGYEALVTYLERGFDWQTTLTFDPEPYRQLQAGLRHMAYDVGPYMAFDAIATHVELTASPLGEFVPRLAKALDTEARIDIDRSIAIALIREGLSLDPAAFVDMVANPFVRHSWGAFFEMTEVAPLLHYATTGEADAAPLVDRVLRALAANDLHAFSRALLESIGSPMESDEIDGTWTRWQTSGSDRGGEIARELYARAGTLLEIRKRRSEQEIRRAIDLALTYLFDQDDYVEDHHPYVGTLDDVCVLRVATAFAIGRA